MKPTATVMAKDAAQVIQELIAGHQARAVLLKRDYRSELPTDSAFMLKSLQLAQAVLLEVKFGLSDRKFIAAAEAWVAHLRGGNGYMERAEAA